MNHKSPHLQISASNSPRLSQKNHQSNTKKQSSHHSSRVKYQKSNSIWYAGPDEDTTKRSCSADVSQQLHIMTPHNHHHHHHPFIDTPPLLTPYGPSTSSTAANIHPPSSSSSSGHGKKITRILYEIGSILSMVGLGKDYKASNSQPQQQQHLKKPSTLSTRRSQVNFDLFIGFIRAKRADLILIFIIGKEVYTIDVIVKYTSIKSDNYSGFGGGDNE